LIQAIWIITDTGQCIFSHKYIELDIDDQLISGLLMAFDAFSNESGIGGVQQIGGEDNQFIYGSGSSSKLMIAALADKRDNPELVEKLMVKVSDIFQEKYKQYLGEDLSYIDLNTFDGFEVEIDSVLLKKIYNRGVGSTIFGTIVALALVAGAFILMYDFLAVAIFLVFLIFVPGLFIGALVAGKSIYGLVVSLITVSPIIGYYAYTISTTGIALSDTLPAIISNIFLMAVTYLSIAIVCGILGGGIIDRRRLFPLKDQPETIEVFSAETVVTTLDLGTQQTYHEPPVSQQVPQPQTEDYYAEPSSFVQQEDKTDDWGQ